MKCPICLNQAGNVSLCPYCGSRLEVDLSGGIIDWEVIYTTNDLIEAQMYKANLESAEIPAHIHSQFDTSRMLMVGALAVVKILVPRPYSAEARELIELIERGER
jgi:hypothetical protein